MAVVSFVATIIDHMNDLHSTLYMRTASAVSANRECLIRADDPFRIDM